MNAGAPFGGGVFIADTSAWDRVDRLPPEIQDEWERALVSDQIASCPPITLEILFSTRNPADYDAWADRLGALRRVGTINTDANWAAIEAYREIAHQGAHRGIPFPDLLAAAAAHAHNYGVLHYDGHFDRLADLDALDFESRWIGPQGTID
ncbi:MAG TPA: PIN domain-containing protein [Solirubrobacteraceae bacterium]